MLSLGVQRPRMGSVEEAIIAVAEKNVTEPDCFRKEAVA
jgi:hypothetical protein